MSLIITKSVIILIKNFFNLKKIPFQYHRNAQLYLLHIHLPLKMCVFEVTHTGLQMGEYVLEFSAEHDFFLKTSLLIKKTKHAICKKSRKGWRIETCSNPEKASSGHFGAFLWWGEWETFPSSHWWLDVTGRGYKVGRGQVSGSFGFLGEIQKKGSYWRERQTLTHCSQRKQWGPLSPSGRTCKRRQEVLCLMRTMWSFSQTSPWRTRTNLSLSFKERLGSRECL